MASWENSVLKLMQNTCLDTCWYEGHASNTQKKEREALFQNLSFFFDL
jgi:hypothetical protein